MYYRDGDSEDEIIKQPATTDEASASTSFTASKLVLPEGEMKQPPPIVPEVKTAKPLVAYDSPWGTPEHISGESDDEHSRLSKQNGPTLDAVNNDDEAASQQTAKSVSSAAENFDLRMSSSDSENSRDADQTVLCDADIKSEENKPLAISTTWSLWELDTDRDAASEFDSVLPRPVPRPVPQPVPPPPGHSVVSGVGKKLSSDTSTLPNLNTDSCDTQEKMQQSKHIEKTFVQYKNSHLPVTSKTTTTFQAHLVESKSKKTKSTLQVFDYNSSDSREQWDSFDTELDQQISSASSHSSPAMPAAMNCESETKVSGGKVEHSCLPFPEDATESATPNTSAVQSCTDIDLRKFCKEKSLDSVEGKGCDDGLLQHYVKSDSDESSHNDSSCSGVGFKKRFGKFKFLKEDHDSGSGSEMDEFVRKRHNSELSSCGDGKSSEEVLNRISLGPDIDCGDSSITSTLSSAEGESDKKSSETVQDVSSTRTLTQKLSSSRKKEGRSQSRKSKERSKPASRRRSSRIVMLEEKKEQEKKELEEKLEIERKEREERERREKEEKQRQKDEREQKRLETAARKILEEQEEIERLKKEMTKHKEKQEEKPAKEQKKKDYSRKKDKDSKAVAKSPKTLKPEKNPKSPELLPPPIILTATASPPLRPVKQEMNTASTTQEVPNVPIKVKDRWRRCSQIDFGDESGDIKPNIVESPSSGTSLFDQKPEYSNQSTSAKVQENFEQNDFSNMNNIVLTEKIENVLSPVLIFEPRQVGLKTMKENKVKDQDLTMPLFEKITENLYLTERFVLCLFISKSYLYLLI